jgi:hypothetical protein
MTITEHVRPPLRRHPYQLAGIGIDLPPSTSAFRAVAPPSGAAGCCSSQARGTGHRQTTPKDAPENAHLSLSQDPAGASQPPANPIVRSTRP